ncbi:MAG TPA: UDP-N-acetylmuramate:L-alanyl-gamma-D-glutamyl-meso-diaminopimelate ligase [Burkholderiaceae bacterium]|nr:UDP-N-acetylmuramate:L-alanyl-gamma-D-glutamyl-meso-diaminopimelate ligase [Burkholderiaceae bacterium]
MHLHIIGICGTFMGGLALIARAAGHTVTGCDAGVYPPMSTQLEEQGIQLIEGFDADQLALRPDLFVVGNVVRRGNPLMEAILDAGLPYVSGPQWLGEAVLQGRHVLAVAGTHGKTTTTAMLTHVLEQCDMAPDFLIGGVAEDFGVSARYTGSRHFVIEADEYDTAFFDKRSKFVHYRPRTAILNNLEYDHADIFPDLAAIETQFHHLLRTVPSQGRVLLPADDTALQRVIERGCWTPTETFGADGTWQSRGEPAAGRFEVLHEGRVEGVIDWTHSGAHNQRNALAAIAAARHVGVAPGDAIAALNGFKGVKRRMEVRGTVAGVTVYDDFAHHPTAIATTLAGLRHQRPDGRILAVIEPRSNTMKLGAMANRLPGALEQADLVFCFGETTGKHALGWDPAVVLAPLGDRASSWHDLDALVEAVCAAARPGDHVLVMSNGGFGGVHDRLLRRLGASSVGMESTA